MTRDEGTLAGTIRPSLDGGPPLFRIIKHAHEVASAGPNVRPCDHRKFVCDEKFSTVTCGECHTQVAPFDALMILVEHWQHVITDRRMAEEAEKRAHVAELRRLGKLRCMSADERAEILTAVSSYRLTAAEVATLATKYRKVESLRRAEKRQRRRA